MSSYFITFRMQWKDSNLHPRYSEVLTSTTDKYMALPLSYIAVCTVSPKVRPTSALPGRCVFGFLTRLASWGANRRRIRLSLPSPLSTTPYVAMGLRVNRQRFRITVNLSGLTWEDTTAYAGKDLNLCQKILNEFEPLSLKYIKCITFMQQEYL